ncbi:MAG: flagellar hook-basal body protein [Oscillospiraceae bacterium]|nr:flagellar hook-basal body protein [Oscillospiraceae bacterium]
MIRGFYTARSGLLAQQENMNVVANNMANVNTVGYKSMKVSFTDLMYRNLNRATAEEPAIVGSGVKINKVDTNINQGPPQATNNYLDFCITGDGYFAVQNAEGETEYTRSGNFIMSIDESGGYWLAAANGERVLNAEGEPIELPLDESGTPQLDSSQIGVFGFSNPYGLSKLGDNRYIATNTSGEATALENPSVKSGYLEGSGVEVSVEMVKVIESQRAFSFNSRMIQVADEIEQTVNGLRQ